MTPFAYLSVLIAIIVGLGLTHLLTGTARLIQRRRTVRPYLPTLVWMLTLFLVQVQVWWVAFDSRDLVQWNFFSFLGTLVIPILAYLLCYLILPDLERDDVSLREAYHENRAWFFGLVAAAVAMSFVRDLTTAGHVEASLNTTYRIIFLALALLAIRVRREWFHLANAFVGLGLFSAYVIALFLRLR